MKEQTNVDELIANTRELEKQYNEQIKMYKSLNAQLKQGLSEIQKLKEELQQLLNQSK